MINFVQRNTPKIEEIFVFEALETNDSFDCYEVFSRDKNIVIKGNSKIAQAMGYYRYLKEYCNVLITDGNYDISYVKTAPLPDKKISYKVNQKLRLTFSYERYAAEIDGWGFDRWEKELDFLAMHGVNCPLILAGSDGVLFKALTEEFRIKKEAALEFIAGSQFYYNQLKGNLFGYLPIFSIDYLEKKIEVGRKATERAVELGMAPIHQGFISAVPFTFRRNYTKADLIKRPLWNHFPPAMSIEPTDDIHIDVFQNAYLSKQRELLGVVHNYLFDPISDVDFKGYYTFVEKSVNMYINYIKKFDPEATWFVHSKSIDKYPSRIDGMVVIDENGDDYKRTDGFNGNDFVVGYKGNLNGRTVLCGNMTELSKNPYAKIKQEFENAVGTGNFFDSDNCNTVFYNLACEMLTLDGEVDLAKYFEKYSLCRYGTVNFSEFLMKLHQLVYNDNSVLNLASTVCARPCSELYHTAPNDTFEYPYDNKELYSLVKSVMASDTKKNDLFRKDIQDVMRQVLSNVLYPIYQQTVACFRNKAIEPFEKTTNAFVEIMGDIDRLLKTVPETNMFTHMQIARQLGDTKEINQNLEVNFMMYHTIFGPLKNSLIFDTNWREWGGMVRDFYLKRWYIFFRMMASYFDKPKKFKDMSKKRPFDRNLYADTLLSKRLEYAENEWVKDYIPRPSGIGEEDTIDVINELIEKYDAIITEF